MVTPTTGSPLLSQRLIGSIKPLPFGQRKGPGGKRYVIVDLFFKPELPNRFDHYECKPESCYCSDGPSSLFESTLAHYNYHCLFFCSYCSIGFHGCFLSPDPGTIFRQTDFHVVIGNHTFCHHICHLSAKPESALL